MLTLFGSRTAKRRGGENRVKKAAVGVLVMALLMMSATSISLVHATTPITVNGRITMTTPRTGLNPTEERWCGKSDNQVRIWENWGNWLWSGSINGSSTLDRRTMYHDRNTSEQWFNTHGIYTIPNANVTGKLGTLYIQIEGSTGNPPPTMWRIVGGTGELVNLHGQGTYEGSTAGPWIEYTGQIHFDP